MTIHVCAACGYPTVGPDMCFYCRPVLAKTLPPFPNSLAAPTPARSPIAV